MPRSSFLTLGYQVQLTEDEGVWVASARRLDTGDTFGPPVPGDRADEAAGFAAPDDEQRGARRSAVHRVDTLRRQFDEVREKRPWPR